MTGTSLTTGNADTAQTQDFIIDEALVMNNPFEGISIQKVKEMNNFRINFYKKHPKATERACRRALMREFNITVPTNVSTKS